MVNHHLDVPYKVLEHQYTYVGDGQNGEEIPDGNKIIRGDNLEALKALLPQYEGRIKCIYIDPPYNTGNEGWVYNDNVNDPRIRRWLGEVVGKEGEDLSRHDKWLCMMYPRLKLLQRLLAEDGVIFISIDDNEQTYLKEICNEIFGRRNFVANIIWQKRTSPDMRKRMSVGHEYVAVFARNVDNLNESIGSLALSETDIARFKNPDNDPKGPWTSTDYTAQGFRPNQMYTIVTPGGAEYTPTEGHCWKNIEEVYLEQLEEGRFWFGADGNGMPRRKTYLSERSGKNVWTWWPNTEVGHTQEATQEVTAIFGSKTVFDYPKPVRLIQRIVQIATKKDSIILDSFAGSGTTAHAVLNMNKADGGNRKFILVEMMDYAESITAERVCRVIDGYGEGTKAVEGTGGSFSFYDLGEPLLHEDHTLNENVSTDKIRQYIYFTETKTPMGADDSTEPYLLGKHIETAYYFYYKKQQLTTLNHEFLATVQTKAENYVIYADICALSEEELERFHISFKKIPRDISRL